MQFERRNIQDLSQDRYDSLSRFLSDGGTDLSLVNNRTNIIYAFAGAVPRGLDEAYYRNAVQIYHFDGMDMNEIGRLCFDTVSITQDSSGDVCVCGMCAGRMAFEISVNDALFDPLTNNIFD